MDDRPRVIVVGAGFGGLAAARALGGTTVHVTVVDASNHHTFQALLYQVATAGLDPGSIAVPVRAVLRGLDNVDFRVGRVVDVDRPGRKVVLEDGARLPYDFLVLAAGGVSHHCGVPGVHEHAFSLKSLRDATRIRSHVLGQFEAAACDPSLVDSGALDVVIVGGGPTGVELAGAFAELFSMVLSKDYPQMEVSRATITLVEAGPALLHEFHPRSRARALADLESRGVRVRLRAAVARVTAEGVELESGGALRGRTVIWCAGVRAHPLGEVLGEARDRAGRVSTAADLSLPGSPEVFVVGDLALATSPTGDAYPQMAPVAMAGGRHAAEQILRAVNGQPPVPFVSSHSSVMATIGRGSAVAELGHGIRVGGRLAWVLWLWLHLFRIIGFRNRLRVLLEWSWSYLTYDRASRLILPAADDHY